jgi:hypothetical protein
MTLQKLNILLKFVQFVSHCFRRCLKFIDKQDIKKNISILGCGWLGFIGESSIGKRISVNGSTTSPNKISILKKSEFILFNLNLTVFLEQSRILKGSTISLLIFHPN